LQDRANKIKLEQNKQRQDAIQNRFQNKRQLQSNTKQIYEDGKKEAEIRTIRLQENLKSLQEKIIENDKKLVTENKKNGRI